MGSIRMAEATISFSELMRRTAAGVWFIIRRRERMVSLSINLGKLDRCVTNLICL